MLLHQIQLNLDAINAKWNDWVLGYGPDKQNQFMRRLGMDDPSWRKMLLTLLSIVIALILLVSAILALRYRPPPRDRAAVLYQRFVDKTGFKLDIGESPNAFANRVSADCDIGVDTVQDITDTYLEARYGDINPAALQRLEAQVAAIN
jgi:hypothetical protein